MIYPPLLKAATFGKDATSGTWEYNVVNDNKHYHLCQVREGELTINLTGDVVVKDRVFVGSASNLGVDANPAAATLKIRNVSGRPVRITYDLSTSAITDANGTVLQANPSGVLFSVFINAKLIIEGSEGKEIIIDGNSGSKTVPYGFIENQGTIDLKHVIIENVQLSSNRGDTSLFKLSPYGNKTTDASKNVYYDGYKFGTTSLDHCEIRNVNSGSYGAVMLAGFNMSEVAENTRTSNKISITNCNIHDIHQIGVATETTAQGEKVDYATGTAGLFRFRGAWVGDLYMKNTKIYNNTSAGDCAGVFWNAVGRQNDHPVFTMDGCEFYNNRTTNDGSCGGAMVLQGEFKFEGAQTKVYNNSAPGHGGGIAVYAYTGRDPMEVTTINMDINDKLVLDNNTSSEGGGMSFYCGSNCSLQSGSQVVVNINGCTVTNNTANLYGGGMITKWHENTTIPLTINLNRGTFSGNKVTQANGDGGGGAIAFRGGNVRTTDSSSTCDFFNNTSTYQGGGIRADYYSDVQLGTLNFNKCTATYGGAITIHGNASMQMSNVNITDCEASALGGGVSLYWAAHATINSAHISGCKAKGGGAVSVFPLYENPQTNQDPQPSTLTINHATITGNSAIYDESVADSGCGGAILVAPYCTATINDGTISSNTARDGAGVYLKLGSSFGMTKGVISDNTASRRGGGVYSAGVGFELKDGLITRNTAGDFGGGIFYTNGSYDNTADHIIAGGTVSYNKAYAGGGIYCNAYRTSKLYINNTLMEYNEAQLGGGLMSYWTDLTLSNAYVRYNKAAAVPGGDNPNTMYGYIHCNQKTPETDDPKLRTLGGIGGGIYSGYKSIVSFNTNAGFGIYANVADYGADDIFALGGEGNGYDYSNEGITLPAIAELGLSGYNVPVEQGQLFWAEDYIVNDVNYTKGSNKLGENGKNKRYRTLVDEFSLDLAKTAVPSGTYTNKYLMLAVGYGVGKATLRKNGLKQGETCVFKIYSQDSKQNQYHPSTGPGDKPVSPLNCYMTIMMVGGGTEVDEKTVILPTGNWIVQESPYWAWTYDKVDDTVPAVNKLEDPLLIGKAVTSGEEPTIFEFTNTKRTDISTPHAEDLEQNSLQK